jgi:hypothetical protein
MYTCDEDMRACLHDFLLHHFANVLSENGAAGYVPSELSSQTAL